MIELSHHDDEHVAQLLRSESNLHTPDTDRIVDRVREGMAEPARARPLARRPPRLRPLPRWVVPALSTAAVVAVMVTATLVLRPGLQEEALPAGPNDTPPATSAETPSLSTAVLDVAVDPLTDPQVSFSASGSLDWIVAGVDPTDPEATARKNEQRQLLGVGAVGDPVTAVESGPLDVSWDGGLAPFPDGGTDGRWLVVRSESGGPPSGVSVRADVAQGWDLLVVYAGVGDLDGSLEVRVDGSVAASAMLPGQGTGLAGYVVTVPLSDLDAATTTQVEVRVVVPDGGVVGLAAAELTGDATASAAGSSAAGPSPSGASS